jgi:hypothetical protein
VQNEFLFKGEIDCLLRAQEDNTNTTIPELVDQLYSDIFQEWKGIFEYKGNNGSSSIDDETNIFALLLELKAIVDNVILTEEQSDIIANIGSIDDNDIHTLFGQAILTQKIIYAIISNYIPINHALLHDVLTNKEKSISAALKQTIRYLAGETAEKPQFLIMDRFREVQKILKLSLVERLLYCEDYGPKNTYNAQWLIEQTSGKQADIAGSCRRDITELGKLYARIVEGYYEEGSLFAQLITLAKVLLNPNFVMDDVEFLFWDKIIGPVNDTSKNTILGILNFCYKNIPNFKKTDVFEENLEALVGGENTEGKTSLRDLVNSLFRRCFLPFFQEIQLIQDDIRLLAARPDIDADTRLFMGNLEEGPAEKQTFCGLYMRLKDALTTVYEINQFQWADIIYGKLNNDLPNLHREIQASLAAPTNLFLQTYRKAWWREDGMSGLLNDMIEAVVSGGINRAFDNCPIDSAILLRSQSIYYLMESINTLINEKKLINVFEPTIEKLLYLRELLKNTVRLWDVPESVQVYSMMTAQKSGLVYKLKNIKDMIRSNSRIEIEGLSEMIDLLLDTTLSTLFSFILNKYKALTVNLHIEDKHSFENDLHDLQEYLQLPILGSDWDSKYSPTLAGKIFAYEEFLLDFYAKSKYIPANENLRLCADFYEIVHDIILVQDMGDSQEKIGHSLSDYEEKSLFGIINKLLINCVAPTLEPSVQNIIEKLQVIAEKITVSDAMFDELQSLITLWQIIKTSCRRVVAGFLPRQAGQILDIVKKTTEKLNEIAQYIDSTNYNEDITEYLLSKIGTSLDFWVAEESEEAGEWTVFSTTNDLAMRLCSLHLSLHDTATFDNLFTIKESFFPGDCPLFYIAYCIQSIYSCLHNITDNCKKIIGSSSDRTKQDEHNELLEQKHACLNEISVFLRQIEQSLQYIAEVFQYTLYTDKFHSSIDVSSDLADIVAAMKCIQQKFSEVVSVLGLPEISNTNNNDESINCAGDCNTISEYFWKMGECLSDLSFFIRYTGVDAPSESYEKYLATYALNVDNIKNSITPMLFDVSLQAHNKRKLSCVNCDIDEIQASLTFLVSSLLDVSCCLSSLGGFCATLTDISPFVDTYSILRDIYCLREDKDLADTLLTINEEVTKTEEQVRKIMDKTIKMPNSLNSFQKKDPRFITDFILSRNACSA